jgi:hypothetical protein
MATQFNGNPDRWSTCCSLNSPVSRHRLKQSCGSKGKVFPSDCAFVVRGTFTTSSSIAVTRVLVVAPCISVMSLFVEYRGACLISIALCNFFRRIEKRMCVNDYVHYSQHGLLPVI